MFYKKHLFFALLIGTVVHGAESAPKASISSTAPAEVAYTAPTFAEDVKAHLVIFLLGSMFPYVSGIIISEGGLLCTLLSVAMVTAFLAFCAALPAYRWEVKVKGQQVTPPFLSRFWRSFRLLMLPSSVMASFLKVFNSGPSDLAEVAFRFLNQGLLISIFKEMILKELIFPMLPNVIIALLI